jgi:uncharacterized phage protein (TIGR01671 family)
MKREIKFRGKSTDTGKWVYGFLSFFYTAGKDENGLILTDKAKIYSPEDCQCSDIWAETVCQFSEITDRNGKRIFEHDIILIHESESSYQFTVEVLFHKGMFCYRNKACGFTPLWYVSDRCEVIGNVFDNSGLIK